jgi:hypothetical protein
MTPQEMLHLMGCGIFRYLIFGIRALVPRIRVHAVRECCGKAEHTWTRHFHNLWASEHAWTRYFEFEDAFLDQKQYLGRENRQTVIEWVREHITPYLQLHSREASTSIIEVNKEKTKIQWVCERVTPYLHLYRGCSIQVLLK